MLLKIRFATKPPPRKQARGDIRFARVLAVLLSPAAMMAWILAIWQLVAQTGWVAAFPIETGLFSRWQIWIVLAFALQLLGWLLTRYTRDGEEQAIP
jgi:hypothetical protein